MEKLWEKIKKTVKEGVATAAEKTEEYTKLGKAKLDVLTIKRKISKNFTELGGIVYDAVKDKKTEEALNSPEAKNLIVSLEKLEEELSEKETTFEDLKKKSEPEKQKKEEK